MTARHTSAEAYASINSKAHSDRALIAELVRRRGPMTRREIASYLHMETSSAAGRVNELMHDSLLVELDEPMPEHDLKRYGRWAHKRRESLTSKRSRVLAALDHTPKTSVEIGREIGLPAIVVAEVLRKLKQDGGAIRSGVVRLPDGGTASTWTTAERPTVADLVSLHSGSLACRRLA